MYHPLLERQIRKHLGSEHESNEQEASFLATISQAFEHADKDRKMLERSIEMTSKEMGELNDQLHRESKKLHEANEQLETLFENINEVFFSVQFPENKLVQMSSACEAIYGYSVKDFQDNSNLWFDLILEEDRPTIYANYPLMDAGLAFVQEYRIKHKNGQIKWLSSHITPSLGNDGKLVRIDGVTSDISKRKESEEKLKTSESHLRASQRIASTGSWELSFDSQGNIEKQHYWTENTYRMFGYEPGSTEVTSEFLLDHIHPDDRDLLKNAILELNLGNSIKLDYRIVLNDGTQKFVSARGEVITDEETGKPIKVIGTIQDITDRVKTSQALSQAKADFKSMLENTATAFTLIDKHAKVLAFNNNAKQLFQDLAGSRLKQGAKITDKMGGPYSRSIQQKLKKIISSKESLAYEINPKRTDGAEIWLYIRMHPIMDETGMVTGVNMSATDITERKKIEKMLRESNERYELATRATHDVIWDWNLKKGTVFCSPNYARLFGYEETTGQSKFKQMLTRIHHEDRYIVAQKLEAKLEAKIESRNDTPWQADYRYLRNDGTIAHVRDRGYVLRDEKGNAVRMVGAISDITETKLLEIERQRITEDLIKQNEHLEQFAYIVSHNLRAPVANILGLCPLLQMTDLEQKTADKLVPEISKAAKRLDEIITDMNQILHFKSSSVPNLEPVIFDNITNEVKQILDRSLKEYKVDLLTDFNVPVMHFNRAYMHSVFYNLISNALKYRRKNGSSFLKISSHRNNGTTMVIFEDNGSGIDLRAHGNDLFGLYKRFHHNIEGKGMGLFMVKVQVEAMGGTINVESSVGKGTKFTIAFNQ